MLTADCRVLNANICFAPANNDIDVIRVDHAKPFKAHIAGQKTFDNKHSIKTIGQGIDIRHLRVTGR